METTRRNMFSLCLLVLLPIARGETTAEQNQTPALNPEEMYQDMFPLTWGNFTEKVLRSKDPWIVIFHDGQMDRAWKTMATHLRGLCWIGMIDTREERTLLKQIDYNKDEDTGSRVYPYGDKRKKQKDWTRAKNQNEARSQAVSSLTDKTIKITGSGLQDFLVECFTAKPSKFPAYLITEEEETSVLWKALAVRFEKYFSFARIYKPSSEDLKAIGLEDFFIAPPALFVLVTEEGDAEKVSAIHYDKAKQGLMNYTNIMAYLFAINSEYRYKLPGDNQSNQKTEAEMEDVIQIEAQRFDIHVQGGNGSSKEQKNEDEENFKLETSSGTAFTSSKDEL